MADKYLYNNGGQITEREASTSSSGAGDAGKVVALNGSGEVDETMIPSSVGSTAFSVTAGENLSAGDWVNLYNDSGLKMRKADATDGTKPVHGYVKAAVTSAASGTFYPSGVNDEETGLTVGVEQFLSTTPGAISSTAPSSTGNLVQSVGVATAAGSVLFQPGPRIVVA